MFFHRSHFEKYNLAPDTANLVAKIANEVIDAKGKVLYGTVFQSGRCADFGTDYKPSHTHTCLALGLEGIGTLPEIDEPIWKQEITQEDKLFAVMEENERIKKLLQERGK